MVLDGSRCRGVRRSHCALRTARSRIDDASDPGVREAGRPRGYRALAQVEPPGQREAHGVEAEIDHQPHLRTAGDPDRLAEPARDEIAATSPQPPPQTNPHNTPESPRPH